MFYQAILIYKGAGWHRVFLPGDVNVPALLPQYEAVDIVFATSLDIDFNVDRFDMWSPTPMPDGTWEWHVDQVFGDCSVLCHRLFELEVTEQGSVSLLGEEIEPPECPHDPASGVGPLFDYGPPRESAEAEQIGLELLGPEGPLLLSDALYDRVERDLELIRADPVVPPMLLEIPPIPRWAPWGPTLYVDLQAGMPTAAFDALNFCFQATASPQLAGGSVWVDLPDNLNLPALAARYEALEAVESVYPSWMFGGTRWTPTPMPDGTWHWSIEFGMGDCPSGCTCYLFFELEVTEPGDVNVLSVDLVPPDCGPQLGCWWVPPCPPWP